MIFLYDKGEYDKCEHCGEVYEHDTLRECSKCSRMICGICIFFDKCLGDSGVIKRIKEKVRRWKILVMEVVKGDNSEDRIGLMETCDFCMLTDCIVYNKCYLGIKGDAMKLDNKEWKQEGKGEKE